jgi:F-type H+-transporting ATP synthase subunit e
MASPTVNVRPLSARPAPAPHLTHTQVVRYSALLGGVFYGIAHRRTLQREADAAKLTHAAHDREHLVARAKEAWAAKQADKGSDGRTSLLAVVVGGGADQCGNAVITNPDDPKFDIEKLVAKWEKDLA